MTDFPNYPTHFVPREPVSAKTLCELTVGTETNITRTDKLVTCVRCLRMLGLADMNGNMHVDRLPPFAEAKARGLVSHMLIPTGFGTAGGPGADPCTFEDMHVKDSITAYDPATKRTYTVTRLT